MSYALRSWYGPYGAETGERRVHDVRVHGPDGVVPEPEPVHHARPVVLDDDVGLGGELQRDLHAFR